MNKSLLLVLMLFLVSLNFSEAQTFQQKGRTPAKQSKPAQRQLSLSAQNSSVTSLPNALGADQVPQHRNCFTVEADKMLQERFPKRPTAKEFEQQLARHISATKSMRMLTEEVVYKIPTIVHVVHAGEPVGTGSNISAEQVLSQFDALNEDFRRLGAGYNEHPDGADIRIEFVPVTADPKGKILAEPGIDRLFGYRSFFEYLPIEFELKPNTIWDPEKYLNIWVVNFGGSLAYTLGYSQFPALSGLEGLPDDFGATTDGVVIGYKYFGRTGNVQAPFNMGRTATHEVGHWLGLRHIWGDGDCSATDYCEDTPPANGANQSCVIRDSCPFDDKNDMIENYMDYSDDPCMSVFTNDQKARMRTVLEVSPRRKAVVGCQQIQPAVLGENISSNNQWFEYTAQENSVVTVSSVDKTMMDTRVGLYFDCAGTAIVNNDNAYGTMQSEISTYVLKDETVRIFWRGDGFEESFTWTLTASAEEEGASCDLATAAINGDNHVPATGLKTRWYSFTPSTENQKIVVNADSKNITVYRGSCANLEQIETGTGPLTITDIQKNETIFIAVETGGGDFNWTLLSTDAVTGESCVSAAIASEGLNSAPSAPYWYTYTMPFKGRVTVSSVGLASNSTYAKIFKNCDGELLADNYDVYGQTRIVLSLEQGDEIKIFWDDMYGSEGFEWELIVQSSAGGETCESAVEAEEGINHTSGAPQWFKYTVKKNSNLRISSVKLTNVNTQLVVKEDCDGPIVADNDQALTGQIVRDQSEVILYDVQPGKTYLILWSEKWSYDGFDWIIEEIEPVSGDACSNAKAAVEGENDVIYDPKVRYMYDIFWTKFIVPVSGKKVVATANSDEAVYIVGNDCETLPVYASGLNKAQVFDLPAGTPIYIGWRLDQKKSFKWKLRVETILPGDLCDAPAVPSKGINNARYAPMWYEYVMEADGSLKVSSVGHADVNTSLFLLDGCADENILFSNDDKDGTTLQSEALLVGLKAGDHIKIFWSAFHQYKGFSWSLEEIPVQQGDLCSNPVEAHAGINYTDYATKWFTYTVPADGNVRIASLGYTDNDTDLYVYDGCDGSLLGASDNVFVIEEFVEYFQSDLLLENLTAGQTLYIKWSGEWSYAPFHWSITDGGPQQGDSCEDPLPAEEGINNAWKASPSWFTYTMPATTSLTISSLGYTEQDTYLEIYDGCNGTLIAENDNMFNAQSFVHLPEVMEGQTILIHWRRMPASANTFNWKLMLGEPEPGSFCQFPTEAVIGTNVTPDYIGEYFVYTFTMPEDNKKLRVARKPGSGMDNILYRSVDIVSDCDITTWYANGEDEAQVVGIPQGQEVRIMWNAIAAEKPGFEWELTVEDIGPGDDCAHAIPATRGVNTMDYLQQWYTYTMPRTGDIKISSRGFTWINTVLEVFDTCDGTLLASNDNYYDEDYGDVTLQSEVVLTGVEEGTSILIRWSYALTPNLDMNESIDWSIMLENVDNNAPVVEDATILMPASLTNGEVLGKVNAEDADGDELSYTIAEGNDDGLVEIDASTGEIKVADANALELINSVELTVQVSDTYSEVSSSIELKRVITSVPDAEGNVLKLYPNPASDKIAIEVPGADHIQHVVLTDLSGKIMKVLDSTQREFSVADVKPGIYMLTVKGPGVQHTVRVAIVR